jgi:uncharacterized protein (TIGR02246 family)
LTNHAARADRGARRRGDAAKRAFDAMMGMRKIDIVAIEAARVRSALPGQPDRGDGMSENNLEDRAAIHDLFTRYCCALDNDEIEAVVDCFTADAILKSPVIDISGHDEIRAFAGRFAAQRAAGTQFRHMVSNIAVTIDGNRAAASAYLLVLISKDGNHRSLPPGRYACELIKDNSGQWRFSRRTVFHDHDYTLDGIGR